MACLGPGAAAEKAKAAVKAEAGGEGEGEGGEEGRREEGRGRRERRGRTETGRRMLQVPWKRGEGRERGRRLRGVTGVGERRGRHAKRERKAGRIPARREGKRSVQERSEGGRKEVLAKHA